ncbi:RNA polymerase I-specific transcription initiation factor RRN3 isoform X1 [Fagus crenata]
MGAEEFVNNNSKSRGFHEMEEDGFDNFTDSELVYHVRDALNSVSSGDNESYNQLVGVMYHTDDLPRMRWHCLWYNFFFFPNHVIFPLTSLKALSGAVSYIDNAIHETLLSSIFRINMWNYGPDVMDALLELIISLAGSNGKHVELCLEMLVSNFTPPYSFMGILKQPRGIARKDQVLSRVHSALKHIADLVPLAPSKLSTIVSQKIPIYAKEPLVVIYMENMLKLESGAIGEFLRSTMLMALMDTLIDLDVDIGWDDILQDDSSKGIFQMEIEDVDEIADYDEEDGTEEVLLQFPRELSRKTLGGNSTAEKLDSLMVVTFEHLKSCEASGRLIEVFEPLLDSFRITVLTAYKSKFSQFVMFYACALDPENCGVRFAVLLADIFVCEEYPLPFRMSAISYLASYLSRANFLSAPLVASMLKRLVDWCFEYCKTKGGEMNPTSHRLFYSGCQAIMYVLCFRMKSMIDVALFKPHLLLIEPILKHKLSPLKVCLPSIVDEFCRQAEAALLFTSSEEFNFNYLLESEHSRAFGGMERLDMFFPFDPCLLRKSDRFIRPHFVYWSMVRPPYDDDEGISDEDVVEQELDLDVSKMSITPRDPLSYWISNGLEEPRGMPARIRPSTSPESL